MVSINCSFPIMIGNIVFVEMIFVKKILCEIAASTLTEDQVCWKADVRWWGQVSSNIWHLQKKQKKTFLSIDCFDDFCQEDIFYLLMDFGYFGSVDHRLSFQLELLEKQTIFFLPQQNLKSKFIFLIRHRYLTFFW